MGFYVAIVIVVSPSGCYGSDHLVKFHGLVNS